MPTTDLSEFDAIAPPRVIGCWYARLTPEQQQKVTDARTAGHVYPTIAKVVSGWLGSNISDRRLSEHFTGSCPCG